MEATPGAKVLTRFFWLGPCDIFDCKSLISSPFETHERGSEGRFGFVVRFLGILARRILCTWAMLHCSIIADLCKILGLVLPLGGMLS